MRHRKQRLVVGVVIASAAGTLTGGVVAGSKLLQDPETFASAIREAPSVKVADIGASGALAARGVFVQKTSTGLFCLWDAPSAASPEKLGGCNSADDPLGGKAISASFAYDGGPDVATVRDARLIGLAQSDVAAVKVVMSDGSRMKMALRRVPSAVGAFWAFAVRFPPGQLRRGVTPTEVVAVDANGKELDRQPTGF